MKTLLLYLILSCAGQQLHVGDVYIVQETLHTENGHTTILLIDKNKNFTIGCLPDESSFVLHSIQPGDTLQ
jgi:hypothetical protein